MTYSVNSEDNKRNPSSPAASMSLTEQLLYRIAALDASVNSGFRRIDEKMDRFQTDLHDSQISTNDRINQLDKEVTEAILRKRTRIDELERAIQKQCQLDDKRMTEIETWQKVLIARMSVAGALIVGVWTFVAPVLRQAVGLGS